MLFYFFYHFYYWVLNIWIGYDHVDRQIISMEIYIDKQYIKMPSMCSERVHVFYHQIRINISKFNSREKKIHLCYKIIDKQVD